MNEVLIKMKMPKSCYFCPMTNDGFYLCKANNPYRQLEDDCEECRPSWCPLIEIPLHGDLIDRDALTISTAVPLDGKPYQYAHINNIKAAPTVIPADESDMDSFIRIFEEDDKEDEMDSFIRIFKD